MLFATSLTLLATLAPSILALPQPGASDNKPAQLTRRAGEGVPYQCDDPYTTKARKEQILGAGGDVTCLAIGMQENGCALSAQYAIGGVYPNGQPKTGDAAEIGAFRNNWGMLRQYCSVFSYQNPGPDQWYNLGQQLHGDLNMAVKCQMEMIGNLGETKFYALQRGGEGNMWAGQAYQQQIDKYKGFFLADGGANEHNGMGVYWNTGGMRKE